MTKEPTRLDKSTYEHWKNCLIGGDVNSIFKQIYILFWDMGIFKLILRSRQKRSLLKENKNNYPSVLHDFIDRNYLNNNIMRIRRLIDSENFGLIGKRSVFSLRTLIASMRDNRNLLTRERYLFLRGLEYDSEEVYQKRIKFLLDHIEINDKNIGAPSDFCWQKIESAHELFDRLSFIDPDQRSKDDIVNNKVYEVLMRTLDEIEPLMVHASKYIAHLATPESRDAKSESIIPITIEDLERAHYIIYSVAQFISGFLFSRDHMPLPIEDPTFYSNWDVPFFLESEMDELISTFDKFRSDVDAKKALYSARLWELIDN